VEGAAGPHNWKRDSFVGKATQILMPWGPHRFRIARLSGVLLALPALGCSPAFVDVSVPPAGCTLITINGVQQPLRCADPVRFGLARENARIEYPLCLLRRE